MSDKERIAELEDAIRKHRDQHGGDRCWMDDLDLYVILQDRVVPDNTIGDPVVMLENCRRFITHRCSSGGSWMSYTALEAKIVELNARIRSLERETDL